MTQLSRLRMGEFAGRLALTALVLLTGCPSSGGGSPEATFELGLSYIREGKYDRVWTLWTPRYQGEFADGVEKQKAGIRNYLAEGGSNVEMSGQFTAKQYGLGPKEFLAAPAHELAARMIEYGRVRALRLRILGEVRIDGDRATMQVAAPEDLTPGEWHFVRNEDGRWLVDETPIIPAE